MEWSDELSLKLIDCYRSNPILWDPKDKHFKLSKKKMAVYEGIADEFNCDVAEVKKKLESLLTSYRRERRREGTACPGMGSEEVYHSKWFAFKAMQFLNDKFRPRKSHNTETVLLQEENNCFEDNEEAQNIAQKQEYTDDDEDALEEDDTTQSLSAGKNKRRKLFASPKPVFKIQAHEDPRIDTALDILQTIKEKKQIRTEKNECVLFGEYLASQLMKFDDHTRAIVKHSIGNILFDAEMGRYRKGQDLFPNRTPVMTSTHSPTPTAVSPSYDQQDNKFIIGTWSHSGEILE
ncbi:uncharacterized protein LOC108917222 [Anoplophora glabripennis]|uniref:uncharacterized protein LOC108917222 n=1 Tax=Anoplophora glabripennis TaxID=217634 RepID=UPI0008758C30|nr:uncharacterized protein LOC108917222 [Anoplophora glabripennis]